MMYIESIFALIAAPLLVSLLCVRGRPRLALAGLLVGMTACLVSTYVSSFLAQLVGADAVHMAVEIAPTVEETCKLLPLLFFLVAMAPASEDVDLAFVVVAVGFATMESAFYLADSGTADPGLLLMRSMSTAMMHLVCGVVLGFGLTRAWGRPWLRAAGTFGLLCLAMTYHGLFNLLVAAGDAARIAALVMPLATLAAILAVRWRRARTE